MIYQLNNQTLQALLDDCRERGEPLQLVDVRTPEEYGYLGHIPGARLLPLHELPQRCSELDKSAKIVLVCEHGVRSLDASRYLEHLGFRQIYNLSSGMAEWAGPRNHLKH